MALVKPGYAFASQERTTMESESDAWSAVLEVLMSSAGPESPKG